MKWKGAQIGIEHQSSTFLTVTPPIIQPTDLSWRSGEQDLQLHKRFFLESCVKEKPYHFRDIHNTILHQLGIDQNQLTYPHLGRDERLTFLEGGLIEDII